MRRLLMPTGAEEQESPMPSPKETTEAPPHITATEQNVATPNQSIPPIHSEPPAPMKLGEVTLGALPVKVSCPGETEPIRIPAVFPLYPSISDSSSSRPCKKRELTLNHAKMVNHLPPSPHTSPKDQTNFANHNAFELLEKYGSTHILFSDDIQGTASVVLAGLIAVLKLLGGTLAEHTFLFFALEMSKQTKAPLEEMHKKIWLVDSKGLIVSSCKNSLQHFKKPWAPEHEPVKDLLDAVKGSSRRLESSAGVAMSVVGKLVMSLQ
ncbi:hypothetical protein LOK49_LG13G00650 [Camellia lanceoleosa]|uniref:Uncharacterized protein n=1 Tax=Camellia lanceoleosa TaxID=1840588 RepID=A0ACC0FHV8_9ERIC|nr:hypothetical protein LOK49_LG13G00650 [Camellia lanceoleosa]